MKDSALAAAHLQGHLINHKQTEKSKVEAVKRPTISTAETSQDWLYFQSRWRDYVKATNVKGGDCNVPASERSQPSHYTTSKQFK